MILSQESIDHVEKLADLLAGEGENIDELMVTTFIEKLDILINNAASVVGAPLIAAVLLDIAEVMLETDEVVEFYQAKKDAFDSFVGMKQLTDRL